MKKQYSRILSLLMTLSLILCLCIGMASAADLHKQDVWTINLHTDNGSDVVTVTRLEKAYATSLTGITIGGTDYTVGGAVQGSVKTDIYGNVRQAAFTVDGVTDASQVTVNESAREITIVVDGTSKTYTREALIAACATTGTLSYSGKTEDDVAYSGIATQYITMNSLLQLAGVTSAKLESISFRPVDWNNNQSYIRTLTAAEAMNAVLAIKSYQSSEGGVTADKADTLNALRLIPGTTGVTAFESVKWVEHITITTTGNTGNPSNPPPAGETQVPGNTTVENGSATTIVDGDIPPGDDPTLVVVNVDSGGQNVTDATVELTASNAAKIADNGSGLEMRSDLGNVTLPNSAIRDLSGGAKDKIGVTLSKTGSNSYSVQLFVDGKSVENVDGGISAVIPITGGPGMVAVLQTANGTDEIIRWSVISGDMMTIPLDGSASFKIIDNSRSFGDVSSGAWHENAVKFVTARGLFQGTDESNFSPDASMTRAMLVTVLYRLQDSPAAGRAPFADVSDGQYYAAAVAWAEQNGIVTGISPDEFAPDVEITREQLSVMLYRYASYRGFSFTATGNLNQFDDTFEVSSWADDALSWAVGIELTQGRTADTLAPRDTATRAEVATILMRFIEWYA